MDMTSVNEAVTRRFGLQHRLGHTWNDQSLLGRALTHASHTPGVDNNERLEFVGDSVLDILAAESLYRRFPDQREGFLSKMRADAVRTSALAGHARRLELGTLMLVGRGSENLRDVESVLAGLVEAIIGSAFVDGGLDAARTVVTFMGIIP